MNPGLVVATARRVLMQLRHDPRTVGLMLLIPCILLVLMRYVFDLQPATFQRVGAATLGIFPFTVMFLVTSVATLRERTTGTLERLLTMPIAKFDLLVGYALAFGLIAAVQSLLASGLTLGPLGLNVSGSTGWVIVVAILSGLLGMALGLLVSAFAATEFQAVQFLPAVVLPQLLLCGLFVARDQMATVLEWISDVLPLTYAVDAMARVQAGDIGGLFVRDVIIIAGAGILALAIGAATLRRRTP
jgi:ABC-2 type transport system permease protein